MNNSKRVSVIINCFNSEKYIEECLKSVLNQTHINLEVIIVDNNSTDNTKKITSVMDKHGMPELEFKISHNGYEILTEG